MNVTLYLCLRVLVERPDVFFFHYITVILPINYGSIPAHHHLLDVHPVIVTLLPIIDTPRSPSGPSILQVLPCDVLLQQHTCLGVIYPGILDKSHKTNITNCTTPEGGTICLYPVLLTLHPCTHPRFSGVGTYYVQCPETTRSHTDPHCTPCWW